MEFDISSTVSSATNSTSSTSSTVTSTTSTASFPNYGSTIGGYFQAFAGQLHIVASGVDGAAILIAFYAGLILIPIGAILYWGHVSRHSGWGMLVGGIILIVLSYTVFPYLSTITPP
ncbi:MAG: hypothetical protein OK456_06020 [Thaumarchaeota archaeon]|nr:hypothetical protein [Nitrososphaerota archaeon]